MSDSVRPSKSGKLLDVDTWDALVKAGIPSEDLQADQPSGPVIFSYSRAEAIRDGVLVDVSHLARRTGFTIPVALTCGVVAQVAGPFETPEMREAALLAVLQELRGQIRRSILSGTDTDRLTFDIGLCKLWALCGPGDQAEPVLTVMLEGED